MNTENEKHSFQCTKCSNTTYETGEMHVAGGFWSKIFDVQGKRFKTISCSNCGYTEIYKNTTSTGGNVLDFFTN